MQKYITALIAIGATVLVAPPALSAPTDNFGGARLMITVHESKRSVRRGATIAFTIIVSAREAAAFTVTVCDELPTSVAMARLPKPLHLFDDNVCVTYARIAPGRAIILRLRARISSTARLGTDRDRAIALWEERRVGSVAVYRVVSERGYTPAGGTPHPAE